MLGRPQVWGLACGGQEGVYHILSIVRNELDCMMATTGKCDDVINSHYPIICSVTINHDTFLDPNLF